MSATAKKRKHPRVEMEIPAELVDGGKGATARKIPVAIANLGPDGAFVKMQKKMEAGTQVRLQFKVSSYPLPLEIGCEVLWWRDAQGVVEGGIGVHFTECPAYERAAIDDFCQQRLEDTRGFASSNAF
jgi:hypothetical protein